VNEKYPRTSVCVVLELPLIQTLTPSAGFWSAVLTHPSIFPNAFSSGFFKPSSWLHACSPVIITNKLTIILMLHLFSAKRNHRRLAEMPDRENQLTGKGKPGSGQRR
jgi:hypothetical protein